MTDQQELAGMLRDFMRKRYFETTNQYDDPHSTYWLDKAHELAGVAAEWAEKRIKKNQEYNDTVLEWRNRWQKMCESAEDRLEAAEARIEELTTALREIDDLHEPVAVSHPELPDDGEQWCGGCGRPSHWPCKAVEIARNVLSKDSPSTTIESGE